MKYVQVFIYTVALVVASEYFSSCCHGQVTSVDCGSSRFRSPTNATPTRRRMSLVSSMIRSRFASSYRRTYTCMRAMNVTEIQISSSQIYAMGSVVEFSLDMSTLESMTNAKLTFYMTSPEGTQEGQQVKLPLQVRGILAWYMGSLATVPILEEESDFPGDEYRGAVGRSFKALDFFQRVAQQVNSENSSEVNQEEEPSQKIPVKFYITRNCECDDDTSVKCCSTLVDSSIHTPSLRVFYV